MSLFTKIIKGEIPSSKVAEKKGEWYAFLDINPRREGHTLVVPVEEKQRIAELSPKSLGSLLAGVAAVQERLTAVFGTKDFQVSVHDGPLAGQEVPHVHIHVIPRTEGDGGKNMLAMWPNAPPPTGPEGADFAALAALSAKLQEVTVAGKKDKAPKEKKEAPKKEEKSGDDAAKQAAKDAEKRKAKIIKEGGKKGVEIEGASDMGGLDFFCTTMELPEGNLEELELSMLAMNAEPDPEAEDRKGCSGHIGKMIYSAGVEQLAMVAYVPANEFNKSAEKVDVTAWMEDVCSKVGGTITKPAFETTSVIPDKKTGSIIEGDVGTGKVNGKVVVAVAKSDPEKGKFALKDKDAAMAAAFAFLRSKGAFPEDDGDDSDDMIFGDDDNLDDYE